MIIRAQCTGRLTQPLLEQGPVGRAGESIQTRLQADSFGQRGHFLRHEVGGPHIAPPFHVLLAIGTIHQPDQTLHIHGQRRGYPSLAHLPQ